MSNLIKQSCVNAQQTASLRDAKNSETRQARSKSVQLKKSQVKKTQTKHVQRNEYRNAHRNAQIRNTQTSRAQTKKSASSRRMQLKRLRERVYLSHFLAINGIQPEHIICGKDDGKEPDFTLVIDNQYIGIELTTLPRLRDRMGDKHLSLKRWYWKLRANVAGSSMTRVWRTGCRVTNKGLKTCQRVQNGVFHHLHYYASWCLRAVFGLPVVYSHHDHRTHHRHNHAQDDQSQHSHYPDNHYPDNHHHNHHQSNYRNSQHSNHQNSQLNVKKKTQDNNHRIQEKPSAQPLITNRVIRFPSKHINTKTVSLTQTINRPNKTSRKRQIVGAHLMAVFVKKYLPLTSAFTSALRLSQSVPTKKPRSFISQADIDAVMSKKAHKAAGYHRRRPLDALWLLVHTDSEQPAETLHLPIVPLYHDSDYDDVWITVYPTTFSFKALKAAPAFKVAVA